jgi:hypothetical protein
MTAVMRSFFFQGACGPAGGPTSFSMVLREWAVTHTGIFTAAISLAAIGEPA